MLSALTATLTERLCNTLRAFRSRNYRLFFTGYSISLIGSWLQQVAMGWLVYRMTGSAVLLGVVGFAGQLPVLFIAPLAGVLSDRWNKRHLMIGMQALAMAQALALAALVLTGHIQVWHLTVLSVLLGISQGFEMTARQSFVIEMVERREDLSNAIALNSAMFNGARFIGPSLAGLLIASLGEGLCFLLNGATFVASIGALLLMRPKPQVRTAEPAPLVKGFLEGARYTFGNVPIRTILFFLALMSLAALHAPVVMPAFAKDLLGGGPRTYGILMATIGAGALAGALTLASRRRAGGLERAVPLAALLFGASLLLLSLTRSVQVAVGLLFAMGFGMMVMLASCNTLLQTTVADDKRGRVMGFYSLSLMGMAPFGSLLSGGLAEQLGAHAPFALGGAVALAGAGAFWMLKNGARWVTGSFEKTRAHGLCAKWKRPPCPKAR